MGHVVALADYKEDVCETYDGLVDKTLQVKDLEHLGSYSRDITPPNNFFKLTLPKKIGEYL